MNPRDMRIEVSWNADLENVTKVAGAALDYKIQLMRVTNGRIRKF